MDAREIENYKGLMKDVEELGKELKIDNSESVMLLMILDAIYDMRE